jgi:hypothetical protein
MGDPSEAERVGVSMPELEAVQVLEQERIVVASGLEKLSLMTVDQGGISCKLKVIKTYVHENKRSSPSTTSALSL